MQYIWCIRARLRATVVSTPAAAAATVAAATFATTTLATAALAATALAATALAATTLTATTLAATLATTALVDTSTIHAHCSQRAGGQLSGGAMGTAAPLRTARCCSCAVLPPPRERPGQRSSLARPSTSGPADDGSPGAEGANKNQKFRRLACLIKMGAPLAAARSTVQRSQRLG